MQLFNDCESKESGAQSQDASQCNKIYVFDSLYTNGHIQMLKIVYSGCPPELQQRFAPFIKYLEFQYTMKLVKSGFPISQSTMIGCSSANEHTAQKDIFESAAELIQEINPYLDPKEQNKFEKIEHFYQTFQSFQKMQETLEQFEAMTGISLSDLGSMAQGDNQMDLLKNLLSSDQMNLFDLFKKM